MKKQFLIAITMIFLVITICGASSAAEGDTTKITPVSSNGDSYGPSISADGNWITYESNAANIVAEDTPDNIRDIFLYNQQTGTTTKITPTTSNGNSYDPCISADGNWITYVSVASNIVPGDTEDNLDDIFLYNRQSGITTKITPASSNGHSEIPSISAEGNWITYESNATNLITGDTPDTWIDIFLYNRQTGITTKVTPTTSNGDSSNPNISADGNWITYASAATNIVAGDTPDNHNDIFLYNRQTGTTTKITPAASNGESYQPSINSDGNWITYMSDATNIVSGDAPDNYLDIFLYNRQSGITTQITSLESNGNSWSPVINGDGNWITYYSDATNIISDDTNGFSDIFLYNRQSGITAMITPENSNQNSYNPSISADGNWIIYQSLASNIVAGDTVDIWNDIFLYNNPAVSDPINPTQNSKPNTTVEAVSNTVGMQKTGLPIAGLLVAILALFGGLAISKRK